jgi:PAS domain S-box-containing protein
VNPALAQLLGRDASDVDGWNVVNDLSAENLDQVARAIDITRRTGVTNRFQACLERSEGQGVWVEVGLSVLDENLDRIRVLATLRDVTTLKVQVEELERLAADLQTRLDEARTLEGIDAAVSASSDRSTTLTHMVEAVARQPGVARATLYAFDGQERHLETAVTAPPTIDVVEPSAGARRVLEELAPVVAEDVGHWAEGREKGAYRAWPLVCNDALVGVLEMILAEGFVPDEGWSRFQSVVCGQMAIAVDNVAMVDRLRRGSAAYADLAEFSGRIEEIDDADELVEHGVHALMAAFGMGGAAYFTRVDGALDLTATWGVLAEPARPPLRGVQLGEGAVGRAALTRENVYVESYQTWPHRLKDLANTDTATVLALPVHTGDDVGHVIMISATGRSVPLRPDQVTIARAFVRRLERALERTHTQRQVEASREEAFRALGLALEYRDFETRGHTDRVVGLARRFGRHLDLDESAIEALAWGAYLHDLGKLAIPDGILLKPARPTSAEFEWAKRHAVIGHEMSRDLVFLPEASRQVVRSHHERWDGSGYPDGLAGDHIPFLARVFTLVDVYDALVSERAYKPAWSSAAARAEITSKAGTQFDPDLTEALLSMFAKDDGSV